MNSIDTPVFIRRIMVFIDAGHVREILKSMFGTDGLKYEPFVQILTDEKLRISGPLFERIRVYYYDAIPDVKDPTHQESISYLERVKRLPGFEIRTGNLKKDSRGYKQKGVDSLIAIDMLSKAYEEHYDIVILVTGDEDLLPIVKAVKDAGKRVFGAFFGKHISSNLKEAFDLCFEIDKDWVANFRD